jgi:cytochrome c553
MKKFLFAGLALIAVGFAGLAAFVWSGLYSVAASEGHRPFVQWVLEFGMRRSVETHALGIETPPLNDLALFERGIGHFQGGCAPCHGAPGVPPNPIAQQMLPTPPDLSKAAPHWKPHQLFWIVKHGLKYTGMPGWPAPARNDEIWALVAFLVRLPGISPEEYRKLALIDDVNAMNQAHRTTAAGLVEGDPIACARCHGLNGEGSKSGGVPRIAGQRPEYFSMTLTDYALGTRPSGIMGPVATYLTDADKQKLAVYYGSLGDGLSLDSGTRREIPSVDPRMLQLGGAIATVGIPSLSIPACEACHGPKGRAEDKNPRYPALAGQHFAYLEQQLKLWRSAVRGGSFDQIMSTVVRNITDEQIRAVSLYYANLKSE